MGPAATLQIDAYRTTRRIFVVIGVLTFLHVLTLIARYGFGDPWLHGFVPMFDTDHEKNAPTYLSAVNMLWCAELLAMIAVLERRRASAAFSGWVMLTVIFVLLPFDELFELHERIGRALHDTLHTSGIFGFAWVIPYGILTIACAALLLRLLARAPADTRLRLIVSGVVYVTGTIGFEMLGAKILEGTGDEHTLVYALCATVEELLEMSGIALLTRALLLHLAALGAVSEVTAVAQTAAQATLQPEAALNAAPRVRSTG